MSLTITKSPTAYAFARCRNIFSLTASDIITPGTPAAMAFDLYWSGLAAGSTFIISIDGRDITFMLDDASSPYADQNVGPDYRFTDFISLERVLTRCYYLSGCTVAVEDITTYSRISFAFNSAGKHTLSVSSPAGMVPESRIVITDGTDASSLPNYRAALRYAVTSSVSSGYTPWVYLSPTDGAVTFDTSILSPYLPAPQLPSSLTDFKPYSLSDDFISYRLQYAESYGDTPLLQSLSTSSSFNLLRGELQQQRASHLLPDWNDALPGVKLSDRVSVLGSDSGRLVSIRRNEVDYLYFLSPSAERAIKVNLDFFSSSSTALSYTYSFSIAADTMTALPICPILMGASDIHTAILLTISDSDGNAIFTRTYRIAESLPAAAQIYLEDKYGLLRSFVPATLERSISFEADELLLQRARTLNITKRTETLKATSLPLPRYDSDRLADALASPHAYILVDSVLYPIHISPATFTAYTDSQNLATLSFDFFVESSQQHALPYALPNTVESPIPDLALLTEAGQPLSTEAGEFLLTE